MAFRHPTLASALGMAAWLAAGTVVYTGAGGAQVFVVGEKSAMADVSTDFKPTRVELPNTPIT